MVKVLENVFGGIICSFAVIKFVAILKPDVCLIAGREEHKYGVPKFLLHMLKNNSAAENCTGARHSQVVNLSIFYNI